MREPSNSQYIPGPHLLCKVSAGLTVMHLLTEHTWDVLQDPHNGSRLQCWGDRTSTAFHETHSVPSSISPRQCSWILDLRPDNSASYLLVHRHLKANALDNRPACRMRCTFLLHDAKRTLQCNLSACRRTSVRPLYRANHCNALPACSIDAIAGRTPGIDSRDSHQASHHEDASQRRLYHTRCLGLRS